MALTALAVFVGEFLVMLFLARIPPLPVAVEAILDATLITVLVGPFLYLLLFRPLALQMEAREKAERDLRCVNQVLEQRVEERTAELSRGYELLRIEAEGREKAEDSVWRSDQFIRTVVESAPCLFFIYEVGKRRCSWVNGMVTEKLGYEEKDIFAEDQDFLRRVLDERYYAEIVASALDDDGRIEFAALGERSRLRRSDGTWGDFALKAVVLNRDPGGAAQEILLTAAETDHA